MSHAAGSEHGIDFVGDVYAKTGICPAQGDAQTVGGVRHPQADGAGAVAGGGGRPWPLARTEATARRMVARRRMREDTMVSGLVVAIVRDAA